MTKRAGKRPYRNGSQRHPPGKTQRDPDDSGLPAKVEAGMELMAIRKGWIIDTPAFQDQREKLIQKLVNYARATEDIREVESIVRTLANAEQREYKLHLQRAQIELHLDEVEGTVVPKSLAKPPHLVVQELIARKDVRSVADRRLIDTDQPVDQSE